MNYGLNEIRDFSHLINFNLSSNIDMCIIPPLPLLIEARNRLSNYNIKIGAQCSHYKSEGPFTGDVSPKLLSNLGCKYVIVGHSERRAHHFETDEIVKRTALSIISNKMIPIICVGESLDERRDGNTINFIKKQIVNSVPMVDDVEIIVAYEPLWAIGSGKIPEFKDIEEVHLCIKKELDSIKYLKVIYGGSVNKKNCKNIFSVPNVDGALIGGASLNFKEFLAIYESVVKQKYI